MIPEKEFKIKLIDKLNLINRGWVDGDLDNQKNKKADIVNNQLKIAIEIKDDNNYKLEVPCSGVVVSGGEDLDKMNKRFADYLRSANNKFKEYIDYKTILLLRTEFPVIDVIRYAIDGLYRIHIKNDVTDHIDRATKYSAYIRKEIGCYIVLNDDFFYFPNQYTNQNRILDKTKIERILGIELKDVSQI